MSKFEWLIIFATFLGPVLAVQAQKFLERWREGKNRKIWIFKTLMTTRVTVLAPAHVEALNMIDVEFNGGGKFERRVSNSWKEYLDHLGNAPSNPSDPNYTVLTESWIGRGSDLLANLLHEMGRGLGFEFDKVHLKKNAYSPTGHAQVEMELDSIRKGLISIMYNDKSINIRNVD
jgi:hypothetical protein